MDALIQKHREVQKAAKDVLSELAATICPEDTERSIAARAYDGLCRRGFPNTWYYECPTFVLLGSRSCLSISGRDYVPGNEPVGDFNLVTVDLSPSYEGCWGDCARSFFIEAGTVTGAPKDPELAAGQRFIGELHAQMSLRVHHQMTFNELFDWTNWRIKTAGFENLDFRGNVGHSIATERKDRRFIEKGSNHRLGDVPFFTFEPHVRLAGGRWGFKHEDIFFFDANGCLEQL